MTASAVRDPAADGWRPMPRAPLPNGIGVPWSKRIGDRWHYGLLVTEPHLNRLRVIHGGILVALADHGLSLLAWEAADRGPCTTIQLNMHFLDGVRVGEFVSISGEVTQRTRAFVFTRGLLRVGEREVAAADGIWRILQAR